MHLISRVLRSTHKLPSVAQDGPSISPQIPERRLSINLVFCLLARPLRASSSENRPRDQRTLRTRSSSTVRTRRLTLFDTWKGWQRHQLFPSPSAAMTPRPLGPPSPTSPSSLARILASHANMCPHVPRFVSKICHPGSQRLSLLFMGAPKLHLTL